MTTSDLTVQRLRHPLRFRLLQVRAIRPLGPTLLCVTLGGEELAGFTSASFDDHLKVFFPEHPDGKPALPALVDETLIYPEGEPRPTARDYTPAVSTRNARNCTWSSRCTRPAPPPAGRPRPSPANTWA